MDFKFALVNEGYKLKFGNCKIHMDAFSKENDKNDMKFVCAKGDWVAFQILLLPDDEGTLSLGGNPAFSYKGAYDDLRICGSGVFEIELNPLGLMMDDDGLYKTDIIYNTDMIHLEKNKPQAVWVEAKIPFETGKGFYKVTIDIFKHKVFNKEVKIRTINIQIEVKNVVMPKPCEYKFYLDLWQHLSNIARKHEVILWSDKHFEIIEGYVKTLTELGQKAISVIVSEIPWSGQNCYRDVVNSSDLYEYSMIKVEKQLDGTFVYNFSAMQRYIDLCFKYNIKSEIEVFGLINIWQGVGEGFESPSKDFPDAVRVRYFDRSDSCYKYMESAVEIKGYIKSLEQYFIEKDLMNIVRVVADEPSDLGLYRIRLNTLKEVAPSFVYKTAINHMEFIDEFKEDIADLVPSLQCIAGEWDLMKTFQPLHTGRLLWYVCCSPDYPNTFLKSPLCESRLIGMFTKYMGIDGFLRWNYTVWPQNPREDIRVRSPIWKAGDTNFVYPSFGGEVLLTNRYKILKRGIEDFELLTMVEKCENSEEILEKVWSLVLKEREVGQFNPALRKLPEELYSLNYEIYIRAREIILDALER